MELIPVLTSDREECMKQMIVGCGISVINARSSW